MQIRTDKKLILSTSSDGVIIIVDVDGDKILDRGEYHVSEGMLKRNIETGTFKDISESVKYDGRIYAYAQDLVK